MIRMRKLFIVVIVMYLVILAVEISIGHKLISDASEKLLEKDKIDIDMISKVYLTFGILYSVIALFILILAFVYL
jgi:hypothetical protein